MLQLRRLTREDGQTMAEYGVVLSFMVLLAMGALMLLSGNVIAALTRVSGILTP